MSIASLTLIIILLYLVLLKGVSYFANRLSHPTVEDFFVADRNIGTIALMGTIVATKVNALALTTAPAFIYEGGILFLQTFIALGISFGLLLYFGPQVWAVCKEHHFITQAELFSHYYQSDLIRWLTTVVGILSIFPFLVVQFIAVAKVFAVATDQLISFPFAIGILGLSTALYVFLGGARAVIWTDVIQGIFLFTLILFTAILFTHWVGGYGQGWQLLNQIIPEKLSFNGENTPVF
ncbi:MAG: Sodium/pantothenate symporter, partial [Cyanobacteriota bacterium]